MPNALNPLEFFAATYFSHLMTAMVPPAHRTIYEELYQSGNKRLVLEGWRGLAKSTLACRIYPMYLICETKTPEVQLFSASGGSTGLSTKWMNLIKKEIETNQVLTYYYGLKKGEHWGQDMIQVIRADGSVVDFYSRGKGAACRGSRGDVIIDDPQSARDVESEAILAADDLWFFSDLVPILLKDQRLIMIGTGLSPLSLLSRAKDLPGWRVVELPAENPVGSGKSAWPEQFPDDFLAFRKGEIGIDRYNAEYLLRPLVSGNPVFRNEWVQDFDPLSDEFQKLSSERMLTCIGFDGAESKSGLADETAIVVVQATQSEDPEVYVRLVRCNNWSVKEGVDALFEVAADWQPDITRVESRCKPPNEDATIERIRETAQMYRTPINLRQFKPTESKRARALSIQGLVQRKKLFIDHRDKESMNLLRQMILFTGVEGARDDKVDALVNAVTAVKQWASPSESRWKPQSELAGVWS